MSAPAACAIAASSATGCTVPISLFASCTDTSVVSGRMTRASASGCTTPPASTSTSVTSKPCTLREVGGRLEHRLVLDRGDDHVSAARVREREALDREVVGLGAAAREDDVAGPAAGHCGDLGARRRERPRRLVAEPVAARRVAERTREVRPHRLERLAAHGRGGGVVEEDHGCPVGSACAIGAACSLDDDVESEVERPHRVRERADRDDVDPGRGDRGDRVEVDPARRLDHGTAGDELDAAPQVVDAEVVEHDRVGSAGEHRLDLVEPVDLDLEVGRVGHPLARRAQGGREVLPARGEHGEVVVLRHDRVGERPAVVAAAAVAHGLPLEAAQPRRGLARVDDARACARRRGHVGRRERGDARHALQQVQADALGAQDAPCRARRPGRGSHRPRTPRRRERAARP